MVNCVVRHHPVFWWQNCSYTQVFCVFHCSLVPVSELLTTESKPGVFLLGSRWPGSNTPPSLRRVVREGGALADWLPSIFEFSSASLKLWKWLSISLHMEQAQLFQGHLLLFHLITLVSCIKCASGKAIRWAMKSSLCPQAFLFALTLNLWNFFPLLMLVKFLSYKLKKGPNYYMHENLPPFCNARGRATLLLHLMYWKSQWFSFSVLFYFLTSSQVH